MAQDPIREAESEVAACHRARARAELLAAEIANEQHVCRALRARLADEQADVDALEGASITAIVTRLRGQRHDRLTAERAEVAAVEVELATHLRAMRGLAAEFDSARAQARQLEAAETRLAAVIEERERRLAEGDPATAARLAELDARLSVERRSFDEIHEAHVAALGALGALDRAIPQMTSARNWSRHDTFLDGEWLSSAIKHDRLDGSVVLLAEVHASLLTLRAELADVPNADDETTDLHRPHFRQPSRALSTMDVWFDNAFSDYLVHQKIVASLAELERAKASVEELIVELEMRERAARARRSGVEAERDRLVRHG